MIISSKACVSQEQDYQTQLQNPTVRQEWDIMIKEKPYPIKLGFVFYRKSRHPFDYNNLSQIVCDALQKAGYLPDDNMNYLVPVFKGWEVDKENPRVVLEIL